MLIADIVFISWPTLTAPPRYLVIHADDAGMYPSVNAATIEALEHGSVTSCSIMVPCPAFDAFAAYAAKHPELDFGIHLTLNCDTESYRWGPVSPRNKVPSLVDQDGFFWARTDETASHATLEEVEIELRAQVEKARRNSPQPPRPSYVRALRAA